MVLLHEIKVLDWAENILKRGRNMKSVLTMVSAAFLVSLAGCGVPKTTFTTTKAQVLKVYSTSDGGHNFVAYVVDRGGKEIVVSDPLGKSGHKAGDVITYIDQKIEVDTATRSLSFTLLE